MNPILAKIEIGNCAEKITQSNISVYPLLTASYDVFHRSYPHTQVTQVGKEHGQTPMGPLMLGRPERMAGCREQADLPNRRIDQLT